jgi:hypothetical protein
VAQKPGAVFSQISVMDMMLFVSYNCSVVASLVRRSPKGRVVGGGGAIAC